MIVPAIIAWVLPTALAVLVGWWRGRELIETPRRFFREIGIGVLWTFLGVFAIHMLWLAAVMSTTGGIQSLGAWAASWSFFTALFWLPVMVTTLAYRAMKTRKAAGISK